MTEFDHTHVDPQDKADQQPVLEPQAKKSWVPTRKWFAALVGGATPIVLSALESGWDTDETKMSVTLVAGLATAYIWSNQPTPSGVPEASTQRSRWS